MPADTTRPQPTTIEHLATAVYPSFAMLTGMQLDVFTPLKDGPLTAGQLADALGVQAEKLSPLLYALVTADLLTVDSDRFANTPGSTALPGQRATHVSGGQTRKFLGGVGNPALYCRDDSDRCSSVQERLCHALPRSPTPLFPGVTPWHRGVGTCPGVPV